MHLAGQVTNMERADGKTGHIERELERLLRQNPRGLSSRQLSTLLPGMPAYEIQGLLRELQRRGMARLKDGGRWQWTGSTQRPQGPPGETRPGIGTSFPEPTSLPGLGEGVPTDTRWSDFRQLCLYYAECIRLEDRPKVSEYAERENARFLSLAEGIDWRAVSAGGPFALGVSEAWGQFIRHIKSRRRSAPRLFLGTPLDILIFQDRDTKEDRQMVSPIFVQQVEFRIEQGRLYLQPVSPVEINHGWLERRFRQADDRRVFMEVCGLESLEPDDESGTRLQSVPGFPDVCYSLFQTYRDWWREPLDLDDLQSAPSLAELDQRGVYNRAVLISQPTLKFSHRLHQELLWLAREADDEELDKTALRHLFPHREPGSPSDPPAPVASPPICDVAEYEGLNKEQREACRLAITEPLSVVTGPPGTGKSRVVAQTMANAAIHRSSALFASRNHQAIEAVIPRLNALVEPEVLAIRLAHPFGQTPSESLTQTIVNVMTTPRPADVMDRLRRNMSELDDLLERRQKAEQRRDEVFDLRQEMDEAQSKHEEAVKGLSDKIVSEIDKCPDLPARAAIDSVIEMLEFFQRAPSKWLQRLVWRFRRWLSGRKVVRQANSIDRKYADHFDNAPVELDTVAHEQSVAAMLRALQSWGNIAGGILAAKQMRQLRDQLQLLPGLDSVHQQFSLFHEQVPRATGRVLHTLCQSYGASLSGEARQKFAEIRGELRSYGDSSDRQPEKLRRAMRQWFPSLLREVPLWATSNLTAGRNIPLTAAAFDLLIIDEASQCDIASVVPLLYRARRVMVVGDPMQLPHIARLGNGIDRRLREKFGLTDIQFGRYSYRVNSFFDLASSAKDLTAAVRLEDHHRCHTAIASYCNQAFYRSVLRVMTDPAGLTCPRRGGKAVAGFLWTSVPADVEAAPGGGAISRGQLEAIVEELERLRADRFPGTVGVVTPFRAQANRIRDRVVAQLGPETPPYWRFHVDTADGFQGDERDVILLSLPGGDDMPRGSAWFLREGRNRFNVAVSRAKALLHVFADEGWCSTCGIPHIQALHAAWKQQGKLAANGICTDLIGPVWEPKLADALRNAEIPFQQQYPACGRYLDFALIREGLKLDVEVDGEAYHRDYDGLPKIDDLRRGLTLIANGWRVLRFWVYELREDMDGCVDKIRQEWQSASSADDAEIER